MLSEPTGATVSVKGESVGVTPARVVLERKESHVVLRLEKEGYEPVDVPLKRDASGWTTANLLLGIGGPLPALLVAYVFYTGIDLLTGAAYTFKPSKVRVVLQVKAPIAAMDESPPAGEPTLLAACEEILGRARAMAGGLLCH